MGRQRFYNARPCDRRAFAIPRLCAIDRADAPPALDAGARAGTERVKRPKLRELADKLGILSEYVNQTGQNIRTSDLTREALLAIMGFDTPSEDAARGWLDELEHEERELILKPVRVVERDDPTATHVRVRLPEGTPAAEVRLTVAEEAGPVWRVDA